MADRVIGLLTGRALVGHPPHRPGWRRRAMVLSATADHGRNPVNLRATPVCAWPCPSLRALVLVVLLLAVPPPCARTAPRVRHGRWRRLCECRRTTNKQPTCSPGRVAWGGQPVVGAREGCMHAEMRRRRSHDVFWDGREDALRQGPCSRSNLAHASFCVIQNT